MFQKEFKQYWKEVEQYLTCSCASRRKFRQQTMEAVNRFLEEQPGLSFAQVKEYLGSPQELAQNYLDTLSPQEVAAFKKKKKLIMSIFVAAFILITAITIALFVRKRKLPIVYVERVVIDEGEISIPVSTSTEELLL